MRQLFLFLLCFGAAIGWCFYQKLPPDTRFASYVVNPRQQPIRLFYRDERGRRFGSIGRLQGWLAQRHQTLLFAMNGGMYRPGGAPQGLFIEN